MKFHACLGRDRLQIDPLLFDSVGIEKTRLQLAASQEMRLPGLGTLPEGLLAIFTRQLAALVGAGVPAHRGLALLAGQTAHNGLKNVLLSPHCADHTPGWLDRAMEFFLDNFERFRKGEPLENVVDKHAGY